MLLQHGARLMARDNADMTPLHYAMQKVSLLFVLIPC
jgi:hypothetical protein